MIRTGWRLVPIEQTATAFDGEGARRFGGRWNSVGVPIVYASEHLSLAALEVRVHIEKTSMRKRYVCCPFHFDDTLLKPIEAEDLPRDWRQEPPPPSLQQLGDDWVKSGTSVILAVPSVIVPSEHNYLLNPRHPNFVKLQFGRPAPFAFDERLFR